MTSADVREPSLRKAEERRDEGRGCCGLSVGVSCFKAGGVHAIQTTLLCTCPYL